MGNVRPGGIQTIDRWCPGRQSGTLERVPDLRLCLERKTGFEPATLTLGKVMRSVHAVHDLGLCVLQSTFCPPNTPQSRQFVEQSTYARLLLRIASTADDLSELVTTCYSRRVTLVACLISRRHSPNYAPKVATCLGSRSSLQPGDYPSRSSRRSARSRTDLEAESSSSD